MSEFKGTPGPWAKDKYGGVVDPGGERVPVSGVSLPMGRVDATHPGNANRDLIILAVNSHADLLSAAILCRKVLGFLSDTGTLGLGLLLQELDAAIAKARGADS